MPQLGGRAAGVGGEDAKAYRNQGHFRSPAAQLPAPQPWASSASRVLTPNSLILSPFWPGALWGWRGAQLRGAHPWTGRIQLWGGSCRVGYGRRRIGCVYVFLSGRQNGGCPQGFCRHEGSGEGEGGLARWAGGAASRWPGVPGGPGRGSAGLPSHRGLLPCLVPPSLP